MRRYDVVRSSPPVVVAFGTTRAELFEHAAFAMFDLGYDLSAVPSTYSRPVVAPGDTWSELLRNWLDELLFLSKREGLVWSSFAVDRLEEGGVQGSAGGMPAGEVPLRNEQVSAVETPHPSLVAVPEGWRVELEFSTRRRLRPV